MIGNWGRNFTYDLVTPTRVYSENDTLNNLKKKDFNFQFAAEKSRSSVSGRQERLEEEGEKAREMKEKKERKKKVRK